MNENGLFWILSGTSGVGKTPTGKALARFRPDLVESRIVLFAARAKREGESEGDPMRFRSKEFIQRLESHPGFVVAEIRPGYWQAIDLEEAQSMLDECPTVFIESHIAFAEGLKKNSSRLSCRTVRIFFLPGDPGAGGLALENKTYENVLKRLESTLDDAKDRAAAAPGECLRAGDYTHQLISDAPEYNLSEWGEFGHIKGQTGREIRSLADLGPRAKWLVQKVIDICDGRVPPTNGTPLRFPQ
jgi:guanylate kinase